jgi:hypothetical protein
MLECFCIGFKTHGQCKDSKCLESPALGFRVKVLQQKRLHLKPHLEGCGLQGAAVAELQGHKQTHMHGMYTAW